MVRVRTTSRNFRLEDTAFLNGVSMDESGKCQIVKRFIYNIVDNSDSMRRRAILDLETLVPAKGSCMADDARYTMKSATWNCFDWKKQSTKFYIDATYSRTSKDDEAKAPWRLAPFNVNTEAAEQEVPFKLAYNANNVRCLPVVNSAGDPIDAITRAVVTEHSFSFYAKFFDLDLVDEYSNSINSTPMRILGQSYPAGTLFLMPFSVSKFVTYEDDGYTVKWKYRQINMKIRHHKEGWKREMLDVGNRARFDNRAPEIIYQYYEFNSSNGSFSTTPVWTDAKTYHAHDAGYRSWLSENKDAAKNLPAHVPYEFGENIPLTAEGAVNTWVLSQDIASPYYTGYPSKSFNEFRSLNWNCLGIPDEIQEM